jgi:hypothetical protein
MNGQPRGGFVDAPTDYRHNELMAQASQQATSHSRRRRVHRLLTRSRCIER